MGLRTNEERPAAKRLVARLDERLDGPLNLDRDRPPLLVGARPRSKGMERKDLLEANGAIFTVQGKALASHAAKDVRVLVVGNPANTNCLIAQWNAPGVPPQQFSAMIRLDHHRAQSALAMHLGVRVSDVTNMSIWGNHSSTLYPDVFHAKVKGESVADKVDEAWIADSFIRSADRDRNAS